MIDYFILHPHVASGKFVSLHGRDELRGSWEELAAQLNAISKDGKQKDVNSWKTVSASNKFLFILINYLIFPIFLSDLAR